MANTMERMLPRSTPFMRLRATLGGEMLAEFFGTFVLILIGDGSVALAVVGLPGSGRQNLAIDPFGPGNWLIIAFGWAFAVTFAVYAAGGVSGAHINPAVTLSFAARRGFPWRKVVPYWVAQVAGALTAAAVVKATYWGAINWFNETRQIPKSESLDTFAIFATFPAEYWNGDWTGPFVDQIVGTAILVALIAALIDGRNLAPKGNVSALLIGLVVAAIGLAYGTNAGYAINPARDLGPRLFTYADGWGPLAFPGRFEWFDNYWWIPIAGPLIGGLLGILLYDFFIGQVLKARAEAPVPTAPEPGRVPEPTPTERHSRPTGDAGEGKREGGRGNDSPGERPPGYT
jgi:glycerol uptake facilitator protein